MAAEAALMVKAEETKAAATVPYRCIRTFTP